MLFLINLLTSPLEAEVSCNVEGVWVAAGTHIVAPMTVKPVSLFRRKEREGLA